MDGWMDEFAFGIYSQDIPVSYPSTIGTFLLVGYSAGTGPVRLVTPTYKCFDRYQCMQYQLS